MKSKGLPARRLCLAYPATPMTPATPAESSLGTTPALFTALRVFGLVVLVLMLASIVYAGWIVLENGGSIGV